MISEPYSSNNSGKRRAIEFATCLCLSLLLFLLFFLTGNKTTPTQAGATQPFTCDQKTGKIECQVSQQLFLLINQDRVGNTLPPLAWEPKLEQSAHKHDLVMIAGCGLQHVCPHEKGVDQ